MFCQNCGEKIDDGAKFCMKCGAQVQNPVSEEQAEEEYTAKKQKTKNFVKNSILQIAIGLTVFMIVSKFTGLLDILPRAWVDIVTVIGFVAIIASTVIYVVDEKKKSNRK